MLVNIKKYFEIKEHINISNNSTRLLIVSKNRPLSQIKPFIEEGHYYFGENRVQEAEKKFIQGGLIDNPKIHLSLIGPLQTNKVEVALNTFDSIQSIDRIKLIDAIYKFKNKNQIIKTKEFFIQINIGLEPQKSGVNPNDLKEIAKYCHSKELNVVGLMCIPPEKENPTKYFEQMVFLRNSINPDWLLSMGMSADYKIAIDCGSNIIRVGSILFNE